VSSLAPSRLASPSLAYLSSASPALALLVYRGALRYSRRPELLVSVRPVIGPFATLCSSPYPLLRSLSLVSCSAPCLLLHRTRLRPCLLLSHARCYLSSSLRTVAIVLIPETLQRRVVHVLNFVIVLARAIWDTVDPVIGR